MSVLSNITQFSGVTITSDQTTGTNNPNATFAVSSLTQNQINNLENVTKYQINGTSDFYTVKPGTMVFNITSNIFQIFINGAWQNVFSINTTASGVGLTNNVPFIYPSGEKASVEKEENKKNGFTYYDTTENQLRTCINNAWVTITTAV